MGIRRRFSLRDLLGAVLRNKVLVVTVFLAALVASLLYCMATPPLFRAEAKLALTIVYRRL